MAEAVDELQRVVREAPVRQGELDVPVCVDVSGGVEQAGQQVTPLLLRGAKVGGGDVLVVENAQFKEDVGDVAPGG